MSAVLARLDHHLSRPIQIKIGLSVILLFATFTRFINLGRPNELVFDEVYYVDGARDYLKSGVEIDKGDPEFVVHPPIGKWAIALGIKVFGDNSFGWRFTAALVGVISIGLIYLIAHRLFNSAFLSLSAATLMSLDGLHLVMSRTALLDIFLSFFLLLSFYLLITERLWLMGITMGLALGTKWSALYVLAALGIYLLISRRTFFQTFLQCGLIPFLVYALSWSGWFLSDQGWKRDHSSNVLLSWIEYHREMLNFHTGLTTEHSYEASAWNWLVLGRPTSFFYATPKNCGSDNCSQEVLALGTPLLWWAGLIALFVLLGYFIHRREKQAGLIALFWLASYIPWLAFPKRTMFYFYSISFQPFMVLGIIYVCERALENSETRAQRKLYAMGFMGLIALCFAYFYPLFVGSVMTYSEWYSRMWFSNWI
jgi:dolichyl-phosphate-mannose--protein O-mannosyl transferase